VKEWFFFQSRQRPKKLKVPLIFQHSTRSVTHNTLSFLFLVRFNLYDKDGSGILDENELKLMQRDYAKIGKAVFIGTLKYEFIEIHSHSRPESLSFATTTKISNSLLFL
jgi:hypothetical protein